MVQYRSCFISLRSRFKSELHRIIYEIELISNCSSRKAIMRHEEQPEVKALLFDAASIKAGFHMIANDRRRSQRDLFPYNRRRSQTIAELTVAIHFVQRKCHMYSRFVLAGKSKQTTWRTPRGKFCCKQIYFFF